ncbi:hypothetical protein COO60DRAFT_599677 [Scenedesmus sp. NREL 46B-D3]|nr:hypothetical protein COO60DRAFT_599677 [Scenedesmus sp. NREL 46B-D3]
MRRQPQAPQLHQVVPRTTVFHCHKSRVKEVEVCPREPHLFWSAGEDGTVRQYDMRLPDQKAYGSANVLVDLAAAGPSGGLLECKGVDVSAAAPHLMAVACGDPYVRVFDRRCIGTDCPGKPTTRALLQLSAPHLPMLLKAGLSRRAHATHASFSSRGDRLVASYHGDHAYVFDVTGAGQQPPLVLPQHVSRRPRQHAAAAAEAAAATSLSRLSSSSTAAASSPDSPAELSTSLPEAAEAAKRAGNTALFEQRYTAAVADFSAAVAAAPWVPGLYTQRALAWLNRGWEGDAAYALRDCDMALALVQQSRGAAAAAAAAAERQARLRQVHALKQLGQSQCALASLEDFMRRYPEAADSSALTSLRELLQASVQQRQARRARAAQQRQAFRQAHAMQLRQQREQPRGQAQQLQQQQLMQVPPKSSSGSDGPRHTFVARQPRQQQQQMSLLLAAAKLVMRAEVAAAWAWVVLGRLDRRRRLGGVSGWTQIWILMIWTTNQQQQQQQQ